MATTASHMCKSCGGELEPWQRMPIDPIKNAPTSYSEIMRCKDCELGAITPTPETEVIPSFYVLDNYYTHGSSHIQPVRPSFFDKVLTKFAYIFDREHRFEAADIAPLLPPGGRICDLGCGHAGFLKQFKAMGFDVIGVDPDPDARAHAAEAGVVVEVGTAEDVPDDLPDGAFDLVIMTHSLEHCRDPRRAVENAYRLTRPGGLCYVEVPNCAAEHFKTFGICSTMHDSPRHIQFFTPSALRGLMQSVGFEPRQTLYQGYIRNFDQSWRAWERTIAQRVSAFEPRLAPRSHSYLASVSLFFRSFWRAPEEKYDSIGLLMARPEA